MFIRNIDVQRDIVVQDNSSMKVATQADSAVKMLYGMPAFICWGIENKSKEDMFRFCHLERANTK